MVALKIVKSFYLLKKSFFDVFFIIIGSWITIFLRYKQCFCQLIFLFKKENNEIKTTLINKLDITKTGFIIKNKIVENKFVKHIFGIKNLFNKFIYYFKRSDEQKHRIKTIIEEGVDINILYWLQLFASIVLATFGLLTNSNPVIIGAMLIAPLLQPIQALSFSISTGNLKLYWKSLNFLGLSILLAIFGSFILTALVPFGGLTNEILSRTTPTILDLGVAFVSGLIAFLVLGYKKLSGTIVGAAIAASLLPPLCATGIGFKFLNFSVAGGTFLLFLANLVAIIFSGFFMFGLYGFRAVRKDGKNRKKYQLIIMIISGILISIPLRFSMKNISNDIIIKNNIEKSLDTTLPMINSNIKLVSFTKKELSDKIEISIVMKVPDGINITLKDKSLISKHLANILNSPVDVNIDIIPITSVYIPKKKILSFKDKVLNFIYDYFQNNYDNISVVDLKFKTLVDTDILVLDIYSDESINKDDLVFLLKKKLTEKFGKNFIIKLNLIIKTQYIKKDKFIKELEEEIKQQFSYLFSNSNVSNIFIKKENNNGKDYIYININFISSKSPQETKLILGKWKSLLSDRLKDIVLFNISILYKDVFK